MRTAEQQDELENALLMSGAVYMALSMTDRFEAVRVVDEDGIYTPSIEVEIDFLKSPYRVTIERLDKPKSGQSAP